MNSYGKDLIRNKTLYIMALPSILFFLIFSYLPMAGAYIAFVDYNVLDGIFGSPFIGFKNFEFLFRATSFFKSDIFILTRNTIGLNLLFIGFGEFCGVGLALLLTEVSKKTFKKLFQSLSFVPYFISWVVVGSFAYNIFSTDIGLLNAFRRFAGFSPINWYESPNYWPIILTMTHMWKWVGYISIIYLSAISSIDTEMYEAANIDGCNKWKQIRFITLPLLKPTIIIMVLLAVGRIFYGDFGMIFNMVKFNVKIFPTTDVIETYVYRSFQGQGGSFAMGSAAGLYQSVMGFIAILTANGLVRKYNKENALF